MNKDEAIAWLMGKRSVGNIIPQDPFDTWQVRIAQADAAMCEQAYWILRAFTEDLIYDGLLPANNKKGGGA